MDTQELLTDAEYGIDELMEKLEDMSSDIEAMLDCIEHIRELLIQAEDNVE